MGACEFWTTQLVKGNSNDAYDQAYEEARDYNGHQEGYSGDIQTCHDWYTPSPRTYPRYGTKAFEKWEQEQFEKLNKRECICVEITGVHLKRLKERRGLKGKKGYRAFYFFGLGAC